MQLELDLDPLPVFTVATRVKGEAQLYHLESVDYRQAAGFVKEGVEGATAVLTLVQGAKNAG